MGQVSLRYPKFIEETRYGSTISVIIPLAVSVIHPIFPYKVDARLGLTSQSWSRKTTTFSRYFTGRNKPDSSKPSLFFFFNFLH